MTEIPTTKQWRADQLSAIRGKGLHAIGYDIRDHFSELELSLTPSRASEVRHGFGTISRFFPEGSGLLAELEEALWKEVYGLTDAGSPLIFNDQYISTGGQFYEILSGRDCFIADLRPQAFQKLGIQSNACCHPYDLACALILEEAGCILTQVDGEPLDCPLDTTTPVSWTAYANPKIAASIHPTLSRLIDELLNSNG